MRAVVSADRAQTAGASAVTATGPVLMAWIVLMSRGFSRTAPPDRVGLGQGFDFSFWSASDAYWWANEPIKRRLDGLDGAGRGLEIVHNRFHKCCHLSQNLETFVAHHM